MTRDEIITDKCDAAGCTDAQRKRHFQLFVFEGWDVHPTAVFREWWARNPAAKCCNTVTAWNTAAHRKECAEQKGFRQDHSSTEHRR